MPRSPSHRIAAALCACLALASCSFHHHRVGSGAVGIETTTARQVYWAFGLLRLNEVDTQRYTKSSVSYDIYTEYAFTDVLLMPLLLPFTMTSRTVTVER